MTFHVEDGAVGPLATVVLRDEAFGSQVTLAPSRGALVTSFVSGEREWLYLDQATLLDPKQNVRGGIPVLFPSPGKLDNNTYTRGGAPRTMSQHGFARTVPFREVARGTDGGAWLELELVENEATLPAYPWRFRFGLRFSLRAGELTLRAQVENRSAEPMPFALGYHPYFAVPSGDKAASSIPTTATRAWNNVTKREEPYRGLDLASGEVDLHLIDHGRSTASLSTPGGTVALSGPFARWVIWTLPSRDFVCLEPWTAPANALNSGDRVIELAPGAEWSSSLTITASRSS